VSKAVYIFIVIFGCAFLSVEYASASPVTTNTTKIKQKTKRKTLDSVHASVTTRVESNVYDPSDSSSWLRGSLWLNPSIDLDKKNSLDITAVVFQEFQDEKRTIFGDPSLNHSYSGWKLNNAFHLSTSQGLSFPLSKESRFTTAIASIYVAPTLSLNGKAISLPALSLSYTLSPSYTWHQYITSNDDVSVNSPFSISNTLAASIRFFTRFGFSVVGGTSTAWSYFGNYDTSVFLAEAISFKISKEFSATVGHKAGGSPLHPDGQTIRVLVADERVSILYGQLKASF